MFRFPKIIIAFLLIVNIVIVYWDNHLRFNEFKNRIDYVLKTLKSKFLIVVIFY